MFGGVVLAAGASTRLGSPKALVPVSGEPAVARVARLLKEGGCTKVVVVLGADEPRIRPAVPAFSQVVVNPHWSKGQTTSVKAGVLALSPSDAVVVWPVDRPAVAPSSLKTLLGGTGLIRVPTQGGHRGHPVLFAASLRRELLALKDDQPLHHVVHADPERVVEVPVNDPGIHLNLDTPADVAQLESHLGRSRGARPVA